MMRACSSFPSITHRRLSSSIHRSASGQSRGRVLLLYSGGLDTSVILRWLKEERYDVVCFMADLGQVEDFDKAKKKGVTVGAEAVHVVDCRRDFVENFVFPALQCNAIYENTYLLGTSIARPCIVKNMMDIVKREKCQYVSHGATGKGNDQVRFELGAYALDPTVEMIVPWRQREFFERFPGRNELLQYAQTHGIPVEATTKKPYSMDENLFHISYESGILEDPWAAPPDDMFRLTTSPEKAPDVGENILIDFEKGIPVAVTKPDGTKVTGSLELFLYLNQLGGKHGVGRLDLVENRYVGIKSRGVYETPGGTILRQAHIDLEGLTLDREVRRIRDHLAGRFAELCYNGYWFSPEMEYVMEALKASQKRTTGSVKVHLYKGNVMMRGRKSPFSLYDERLSSMVEAGGYDPRNAEGFIKINAIRLKANHRVQQKFLASQKKQ